MPRDEVAFWGGGLDELIVVVSAPAGAISAIIAYATHVVSNRVPSTPPSPSKFGEWFNRHVAHRITALGFTPRTVTLEVIGRRSGKLFRMAVSPAWAGRKDYLVSIFGEQERRQRRLGTAIADIRRRMGFGSVLSASSPVFRE